MNLGKFAFLRNFNNSKNAMYLENSDEKPEKFLDVR